MDPRRPSRRPPYPALPRSATSSSTSAFQHSASSISSAQSAQSASSVAGQTCTSPLDRYTSCAPLPSPTVSQGEFFNSMQGQISQQQMLQLQQLQQLQQQQMAAAQQQQQMANYQYRPDRSGAGATAQETNSYINQLGLVAEAAKRAEMAVLERDMNGIELG